MHSISFNIFCFFYYVQVLGVPGTVIGTVAAIAIVVDAISDPAIGMLSDRLQHRLGRRHPLMLIAALPTGLCFTALFAPPVEWLSSLSETSPYLGLGVWMLVFASGTRICLTFFSVPHLAFGSELDPDHIGRSRTMSWHAAFLWVGGASCHFLGLTFFFNSPTGAGTGMLEATNYPIYGFVWGTILTAIILASTLLTLARAQWLPKPDKNAHQGLSNLGKDFSDIFTNRNYVWLLAGLVLYAGTAGMHESFTSHLAFYYFELSSDEYRFYGFSALIGYGLGFAVTTWAHKHTGKVKLLALSTFGNAIASSVAVWLRMSGVLPDNGSAMLFPVIFSLLICYYGLQSMLIISVLSLLGDIADEHELNKGQRREAVLYSARSFFGKVSLAFGHLLAGVMLDLIKFPLGPDVIPGQVDPEIISNMGVSYGIVATVPGLFAGLAYLQCKMTKKRHQEILKLLQARRNKSEDDKRVRAHLKVTTA